MARAVSGCPISMSPAPTVMARAESCMQQPPWSTGPPLQLAPPTARPTDAGHACDISSCCKVGSASLMEEAPDGAAFWDWHRGLAGGLTIWSGAGGSSCSSRASPWWWAGATPSSKKSPFSCVTTCSRHVWRQTVVLCHHARLSQSCPWTWLAPNDRRSLCASSVFGNGIMHQSSAALSLQRASSQGWRHPASCSSVNLCGAGRRTRPGSFSG